MFIKKKLLKDLKDAPIMQNARSKSMEELLAFRKEFLKQKRERQAATRHSYLMVFLYAVIGSSLGLLLIGNAPLHRLPWIYLAGISICTVYWLFRYGNAWVSSMAYETAIITILDATIKEKRSEAQSPPSAAAP